jgi:O-antigen/teichoic acid export membrane protein
VGYGLSVFISAVVTLLSIPVVIAHSGSTAWASIALGQAIGTGCAVLVGFGWGITGPTQVAIADKAGRARFYVDSLRARLVLFLPGAVLALSLAVALSQSNKIEAATSAVAFTMTGLAAGWFFTGAARPYSFLLLDTLPRVLGTVGGILALILSAPLIALPAFQLFGIAGGVILSSIRIRRGLSSKGDSLRSLRTIFMGQSSGIAIAGISALYISVPISLVAWLAPASLPLYALADKVLRFSTSAFAPVTQFLQGWVPAADSQQLSQRVRRAFVLGMVMSITLGIAFVVFLPWISSALSKGTITLSLSLSLPFGFMLGILILAQVTGLVCLLALGREGRLAVYTAFGVVVAIPGIFIGVILAGAQGAAWAMSASEMAALAPQVLLLAGTLKRRAATVREDSVAASVDP